MAKQRAARGTLSTQAVVDVHRTTISKRWPQGNAAETAFIISQSGPEAVTRPAVLYHLRLAGKRSGDARIALPARGNARAIPR